MHIKLEKLKISFILLGILFSMVSCEKDSIFPSAKKRMEGKWRFEKVEFNKRFSFSRKNISSDFDGVTIEFKGNKDIEQESEDGEKDAYGRWDVRLLWQGESDENSSGRLEGHMTNSSSGQHTKLDWRNLQITKKKISFLEYKDGGTYRYRLKKM